MSPARALAGAIVVLVSVSAPTTASDHQQPAAGRVQWDHRLGAAGRQTEFRALAPASNQSLLVAATERDAFDPSRASAGRLLLWRLGAAGEVSSETELRRSPGSRPTTTASVRDVVADGAESVVLADFEAGRPSIVRIDASGKQTTTRELVAPGRVVTLMRIVPFGGGRFAAVGHESLDALAIGVDAAGTVLWEKKDDRGRMEFFVDGLPIADGLLLIGNSGQYDPVRAGPSSVWVGRYDPQGQMKSQLGFPGRHGRAARSSDGGYVVVYDRSDTNAQDIRVKGLTADLKEAWEHPLVTVAQGFTEFQIAARNGGFIVAGSKEGGIYVAWLDDGGRTVGTFESEKAPRSIDLGVTGLTAAADGAAVIATSNIEARGPGDVQQTVRIRKVAM